RFGVEIIAVGKRFRVPLPERLQQVQGVVPGTIVEVAVVVFCEGRPMFRLFRVRGRFHSSSSLCGRPQAPRRYGSAVELTGYFSTRGPAGKADSTNLGRTMTWKGGTARRTRTAPGCAGRNAV